ncbi:DUF4168 domain-containing protein [Kovacikia minuta CCNUW1]|uniref:DUF4168 domain-containing protein n=1 Tax=Kovacikia minuta TaxID=2931930 RepID=UPI001CCE982F|nr:DUF4168 domain-containing protein [Kovacikia minuta]UBF28769.1 DUF4168 domain-containing protein [Kovacikia minuta CCNUW1]
MINSSTDFMQYPLINRFTPMPIHSPLSRIAIISALSTVSLLSGLTFHPVQHPVSVISTASARAQSGDPVVQYAQAAYEIERTRQKKYSEAKQIMGGDVPADVCRQQNIPSTVRGICDEFLKESANIIKKNGLTIGQFNDITRRKDSEPALQQQIQSELLRLQKSAP